MLLRRFAAPIAGAIAALAVVLLTALLDPTLPLWGGVLLAVVTGGLVVIATLLVRVGRSLAQARLELRHLGRTGAEAARSVESIGRAQRALARTLDETNDRARRAAQALRLGSGGVTQRVRQDVIRDVDALLTLHGTYRAERSLVPLTSYSALPSTALMLADLVRELPEGATVLELGGGASSVWMGLASAARGRGVRVVSVDHDRDFVALTRAAVERHGLTDIVDVRHAPLEALGGEGPLYYAPTVVDDVTSVDLLFIDGPPGATGPGARLPAVELFADRLQAGASIVVDDADRADERDLVEAWLRARTPAGDVELVEQRERAVRLVVAPAADGSAR